MLMNFVSFVGFVNFVNLVCVWTRCLLSLAFGFVAPQVCFKADAGALKRPAAGGGLSKLEY